MAKQIIILERNDGSPAQFRIAFWFPVAIARQSYYANPEIVSAWKDADAAEVTAIKAGQVHEKVITQEIAPGSSQVEIQTELESLWNSHKLAFDNSNVPNRYGSFWDGITWTLVNN